MKETEVKSILHDATPSWNGYNYQGKVGLYVCLANILKEAKKGIDLPDFDIFLNEHHIEYEWIEDFAIKRNDTYLSLHQVKHKAQNNFSEHVEAIATILYRNNGVLPDTDIFKYFTFNSKKRSDIAAEKKAIKAEITVHKLVDDDGSLDSNWNVKILAVDIKYRNKIEKCFGDFELLSKKAFGSSIIYFHTFEEVTLPSKDISRYNVIPSNLVNNLTFPKSLSCQKIFLSFDSQSKYNLALSDDALNAELDRLIHNLLILIHPDTTFSFEEKKLYKTALCALIDQNLVIRHQHIRDKRDNHLPYLQRTKPSIFFKEIALEIKKTYRVQDKIYWNLVCRENFETAYKEQLDELYQDIKTSTSYSTVEQYRQYVIRLEYIRNNIIEQYFPDRCIHFLKQIYPHKIHGPNDRQFYEAISEPQKIKSVFLDFIQEVMKPSGELSLNSQNGTVKYQPSCISFNENNQRRKDIEIDKVKKGLADNHGFQPNIFNNVDYIVINSTDAQTVIPAGIEKITEVESYEKPNLSVKESDSITNKKEVSFMDCRKALGEINE